MVEEKLNKRRKTKKSMAFFSLLHSCKESMFSLLLNHHHTLRTNILCDNPLRYWMSPAATYWYALLVKYSVTNPINKPAQSPDATQKNTCLKETHKPEHILRHLLNEVVVDFNTLLGVRPGENHERNGCRHHILKG